MGDEKKQGFVIRDRRGRGEEAPAAASAPHLLLLNRHRPSHIMLTRMACRASAGQLFVLRDFHGQFGLMLMGNNWILNSRPCR